MVDGGSDRKSRFENPKSSSRREWLLQLGETAFLLGFSGAAVEANLGASAAAVSSPFDPALPPGLYEPSNDHLSHALSNDAKLHPIPPGSATDYVRASSGPFQPEFLTAQEFQTVRRMVEWIIGDGVASSGTDAADGQSDTGTADEVAEWIDLRLSQAAAVREAAQQLTPDHKALAAAFYGAGRVEELESDDSQKTCRDGLRWLDEQSQRRQHASFLGIDPGQQLELLRVISDDRSDKSPESAGTRFFVWIKGETIRGYYTSQAGLKELGYRGNAFYGEQPGCEGTSPLSTRGSKV